MLTHKKRALIWLIDELSRKGRCSRFMVIKALFLLKEEERIDKLIKFYHFYPYRLGPFSNVVYHDLNSMRSEGFLDAKEKLALTPKGKEAAKAVDWKIQQKVRRVAERFESDEDIQRYVYNRYREYTVKSTLIKRVPLFRKGGGIFTIGYESRDIDSFLNTLIRNRIDVVIDVRRNPFSMSFSFIGSKLKEHLEKCGIEYAQMPELGIEGSLRKNLRGKDDYQQLFKAYKERLLSQHTEDIEKIISSGKKRGTALLCFEKEWDRCHRGVLAGHIEKEGMKVTHL